MIKRSLGLMASICVFFVAFLLLAHVNRDIFPFPWNDESRFLLPAYWWAQHGNFSPLSVNAPHGIYWVPDGFTVWFGVLFRIFGTSLAVAQAINQVTCALGIVALAVAAWRATASTAIAVGVLACGLTPPVLFAANLIRMEPMIFLLLGAAVLLHFYDCRLAASAVLLATILVHPAGALPFAGYAVLSGLEWLAGRNRPKASAWSWLILALVLLAVGAEAIHYLAHSQMVHSHMAYQVARKTSNVSRLRLTPAKLLCLVFWLPALAITVVGSWKRDGMPGYLAVLAIPSGVGIYALIAGEMAYTPYLAFWCPVVSWMVCASVLSRYHRGSFVPDTGRKVLLPETLAA